MESSEQTSDTGSDATAGGSGTHEEPHKRTARQLLHWATGDRDAEAKALADASDGPVSEEEAKIAVQAAHGDIPSNKSYDDSEVADPSDAAAVHTLASDSDRGSDSGSDYDEDLDGDRDSG